MIDLLGFTLNASFPTFVAQYLTADLLAESTKPPFLLKSIHAVCHKKDCENKLLTAYSVGEKMEIILLPAYTTLFKAFHLNLGR